MAVTSTGHLYAWGCADGGWTGLQCPPGVLRCVEPGPVAALDSEAGAAASSARTFDSDHIVLLPERVASLQGVAVEAVACGGGHTLVLARQRGTAAANDTADAS
eukprot:TRINITY_DN5870_c0_g1_i1.p4 TRINITY_DN5870_c0_g1~~TRINITY_DN5870_c0_g1_i1.p4  ORF type:complete len:104 (+),score=33.77 TRINITY_DN5870_c0_g1_i1:433-744(+)